MTDIVIVNWNSGILADEAVQSIYNSANYHLVKNIFVVDNNSEDGSADRITPNTKLQIIRNTSNEGFAKACNKGFELCKAEFTLLLNPDARLMENTLEACTTFMAKNNNVDILGCRLIDDNNNTMPSCSRFPTALRFFFDATGLSKIAPSIFKPATIMTDWKHDESRYVDQVMGAFMFMRTKVFEKIGYFDERFFVYFEELDFSLRLKKHGGCTYYNKNITAFHKGEGTTQSVKAFRLYLNLNSRLKFAHKHFALSGYLIVWLSTFLIEPFSRAIFLLLQGRINEIAPLCKGYYLLIFKRNREQHNK
jgi:GT2 family glycosyltransferase